MTKLDAVKKQFEKALQRFEDVLSKEKDEYIRDSAIQRYEFTFDLSWKLIKAFLDEDKGVICNSPKGCFREAYKHGIIEYDEYWLEMTDMRNETVHTYKEEMAEEIYKKLPEALKYFQQLRESLKA